MTDDQRSLAAQHFDFAMVRVDRFCRAKRLAAYVDRDELCSAAMMGLVVAAQRFDPRFGEFDGLAATVIWRAMQNAMYAELGRYRKTAPLPDSLIEPEHDGQALTLLTERRIDEVRRRELPRQQARAARWCWMRGESRKAVAQKMRITGSTLRAYLTAARKTMASHPKIRLAWNEYRGAA